MRVSTTLGVGITRTEADWGFREPEEGRYNWDPMDARMDFLQRYLARNPEAVGWVAGLAACDGSVDETSLSRLQKVLEGSSYDWVDVHLYDRWEDFAAYVEALRRRLPDSFFGRIVVTEFGGPHPVAERHLSNTEHAQMVERYISAIDPLDVAFA